MTYATVRAITSPELVKLRSGGQWSKLYLAIFKPNVIYSARLASLPTSFDSVVQIAFDTGSGTLSNVKKDMSLYVGTTAGAYDLGIARIRKVPIAGVFYIGEESEINWQATCHLTVVDEFDLWARHLRTVDDTTFYMDYDIAYTDQNENFDPVPIMGGHRVLKLTGSSISTQFDFSNSYVIGSTISAYSVACPGASLVTNPTTSTPTITFNTTGWHPVYLTVTAANGKTYTGVRYVYVYSVSAMPATVFQLGDCSEDYETGGWSFTVTMQDEVALANVPDRTMCILFSEDYYNDEQVSIGQLTGCENIICIGKIGEEAITINAEQGEVSLRIYGYHYWFGQINAFPTGVIQVTETATNWAEMESPTVDKVVHRLLHWGCTATTIMDIYLTDDTRLAKELISPTSSLWAQLQELSFATILARVGIDRYSRMFIQVEPQLVLVADRTYATVMTITKEDWQEAVRMQRVVVNSVGQVNSSGVTIENGGNGNSLFSLSPGHVFKHYGGTEVADRLLLSTQLLSNRQAGLLLGWRNNPYPNNEFKLSANNRMIDCFPRQRIAWSVVADDNPRAFTLSGNFVPRRVEFTWDASSGFMETSITLELESVEQIYTDGDIPGGGEGDLSQPPSPPDYPPLPDLPPIILPIDILPVETQWVLLHDVNEGLIYTKNFQDSLSNISWISGNSGLTGTQPENLNWMGVCPNGAVYVARVDLDSGHFIARAPFLGAPFVPQTYPDSLFAIAINPLKPEEIGFITSGSHGGTGTFRIGANNSFSAPGATVETFFDPPHRLSYGLGHWLFTGFDKYFRINAAGTSTVASGTPSIDIFHLRAGTTGRTFHRHSGSDIWRIGDNNLASISDGASGDNVFIVVDSVGSHFLCADCDPTGTYIMTRALVGAKGKSSDGGVTWGTLGSLPAGNWVFGYAGPGEVATAPRFVAAGAVVRYTPNFGTSWEQKENSSLTDIAVFPNINLIKVVK